MTSFPPGVREALEAEQGFVRVLGGYTVGLPGGTLLVNERLPLPQLNVVQTVAVARLRQSQFFEAALDHYFQRALRPSFRVPAPVPPYVDATLAGLGFRPHPRPEVWLVAGPDRPSPPERTAVRRSRAEELEASAALWAGGTPWLELRRQVEVGLAYPNPGEQLAAFRADGRDGSLRSAALGYRRGECVDLELVTTVPAERGRGAATELVEGVLGDELVREARFVALRSEEPRLGDRLAGRGFRVAAECARYELDRSVPLVRPSEVGPSAGPLWRPPRAPPPSRAPD